MIGNYSLICLKLILRDTQQYEPNDVIRTVGLGVSCLESGSLTADLNIVDLFQWPLIIIKIL